MFEATELKHAGILLQYKYADREIQYGFVYLCWKFLSVSVSIITKS